MVLGTEWAQEGATAVLVVPSVLIPEFHNAPHAVTIRNAWA